MLPAILKGEENSVAPVPLNTSGLDANLVGLGSYIVNVTGDCNGCHSAGPATEFLAHGNPYTRQAPNGPYSGVAQTNPATYLGGGRDFGGFPAPNSPLHIISRNLTPDASGKPEGHTLAEFFTILRTGVDMDQLHPNCTGAPDSSCTPFPFDGSKLLIMRWPAFRHMSTARLQQSTNTSRRFRAFRAPTRTKLQTAASRLCWTYVSRPAGRLFYSRVVDIFSGPLIVNCSNRQLRSEPSQ
jgi:hypothetical protein